MNNKGVIYSIIFIGLTFARLNALDIVHDDRIIDILLSHDKQYYVTGSKDGKVIMWDNYSDQIESIFTVDTGKVITNIDLSFDNKLLAIGFNDGTIDIVNRDNQKKQSINSQDNNKIILLKFLDNQHLISCNKYDVIKLWGVSSSSSINEVDDGIVLIKQFSAPVSHIVNAKINSNQKNILARLDAGNFARWDIGEILYINMKEDQALASNKERIKMLDTPKRSWWNSDPYEYYNFNISADGS